MKTLEQYFKESMKKGTIDHNVRISVDDFGTVSFYIHPLDVDGDTLDFIVRGDKLEQLNFQNN